MKTAILGLVALSLLVVSVPAHADDEPTPNCKLVVRTRLVSGKRKLEILETHTADRETCRAQARERELAADVDIESVKATWGWRGTVTR